MLSTDCVESNAAPVRERLLAILDDLRNDGPEQAELDWNHSMLTRHFADPTDEALTFRFEECVAAIEGQGSSLTLVSSTGTTLRRSPDRYAEGDLALDGLRRRLPAGIIVPLDESGRKVNAVAEQKLSAERQSPLVEDLESLVAVLAQDEELINIAEARRGRFKGLRATTDRRLMFIFNGDAETDFREVPLEAASYVSVKGLRKNRLCLTAASEDLEFSDIWPRERLGEIHSQLIAAA